jgi:hypothetical protein
MAQERAALAREQGNVRETRADSVTVDRSIPRRRALPGEYMSDAELKARKAEEEGDAHGAAYWWSIEQAVQQAPPLSPAQAKKIRMLLWGGADGEARLAAMHRKQLERAAQLRGMTLDEARRLTTEWGIHPSDEQLRQLISS